MLGTQRPPEEQHREKNQARTEVSSPVARHVPIPVLVQV